MRPIYKILIIAGIVIVAVLGIYFGLKAITSPRPSSTPTENVEGREEPQTIPTENGTVMLRKISENPVFDFWVNPNSKEVFYLTANGFVFGAKEGPDLELSGQELGALNSIKASPSTGKLLTAFGDPRTPQWAIFDVVDGVWRPLPREIANTTWGETDEELISLLSDSRLVKTDLTENPPTHESILQNFDLKDTILSYIAGGRVLVVERPSVSYAGRAWSVDIKTKRLNLLFSAENGLLISF